MAKTYKTALFVKEKKQLPHFFGKPDMRTSGRNRTDRERDREAVYFHAPSNYSMGSNLGDLSMTPVPLAGPCSVIELLVGS